MKQTTEEIVKALRRCATGEGDGCASCSVLPQINKKQGMIIGCAETLQLAAADRLEVLEATQPRWISVEERLPSTMQKVLVYYKNWAEKWTINVGMWTGYCWYHYDATPESRGADLSNDIPTHWMPLPEPPKECDEHE